MENVLFYPIFRTSWDQGCRIFLIFELLTQKGHGAVEVVKSQAFHAFDVIVPMPSITETIRTRHHQPVQNGEENRTLYIESKASMGKLLLNRLPDACFYPQPFKDKGGPIFIASALTSLLSDNIIKARSEKRDMDRMSV